MKFNSPRIPKSQRMIRMGSAFLCGIVTVSLLAAGCQDDQEKTLAERNAAVQQQKEHDRALAQARADLERQSAAGNAAYNPPTSSSAPMASAHPDTLNEEDIGLPIYPNAHIYKLPGDSGGGVKTGNGINIVLLETPDNMEPVIAFYEPKLTHTKGTASVKPARQDRTEGSRRIVKFTETLENQAVRIVKLTREPDKTVIELMNIQPSVAHSSIPNPQATSTSAGSAGASTQIPLPPIPDPLKDPLKPPPLLPNP